ncbi:FG-GAP-like repeat-containing protein [Streptomyces sp. NPDC059506]|uniref:FG-GAP-like repeat-containing protein n=1 Tax=Streptomyces sp. NPDC059506 TaxID=3347751 RepID=UPI0036AF6094
MTKRALVRGGIAAAASFALALGLGPLSPLAHGETAAEAVVPGATSLVPRTHVLKSGPSGFLRHEPDRGEVWTSHTGQDTVVNASPSGSQGELAYGADSDVVAQHNFSAGTVTLRNMATGETGTVPVPGGHSYLATLGSTVVTTTSSDGTPTGGATWHLSDLRDGTVQRRTVADVPAGITAIFPATAPVGDAHGMLVQYRIDGQVKTGWLDTDESRLVPLPRNTAYGDSRVVLTATHLLSWEDSTVFVYSRQDLTAAPRTVPLPNSNGRLMGMVGDTVIATRHDPSLGPMDGFLPVWRVEGIGLDGSARGTLVARALNSRAIPTADGGLLVAGGPDPSDWGVNLLEAGPDGTVTGRRVAESEAVVLPNTLKALSLTQGRLTTMETDQSRKQTGLYSRTVDVTGALSFGSRTDRGPVPADYEGCSWQNCLWMTDTGDGRTVFWGRQRDEGAYPQPQVVAPGGSLPGTPVDASRKYDLVRDAAGRFVAMTTHWDGTSGGETAVVDLDSGKTVLTVPEGAAALWGTTLWVGDGNNGVVPIDLRTGERGEGVWFGRGCLLEDFQAVQEWLLWSCVGSTDSQGVYNTTTRTKLTLKSGTGTYSPAKLGDGFVVTTDDGKLRVNDVRGETAVSRILEGSSASNPWTVDPYTGLIAHTDGKNDIHLVPSGVPASPLAQTDAVVAASANVKGGAAPWKPKWWLSRPAASWKLAIKHKPTGSTVRTLTGGQVRGAVTPSWDGKDASGKLAPNGTYTWTLTATPADGQGAALTKTGTVKVTGAAAVRRDHAGSDGFGDLLTHSTSGYLTFQQSTGTGTFSGKVSASGWSTATAAVPFGDLNGDRCNDVLVRTGSGELRAYKPACGKAVTTSTAYTSLGTGWGQYNVLTSPGDISGDGRADLIARQASTGDIYLYKATSTGKLSSRTKIRSAWTGYKKIVGVGDLNGDGHGDLIAQDKSNELWRYDGTATGQFASRVKVFNDWGSTYNVIVGVGDITGDGKSDIVARDTSGNLYRNNGNGKGSFGSRTRIATGWGTYKGLY